jgi:DNA-binding transcriptional MerR regulator
MLLSSWKILRISGTKAYRISALLYHTPFAAMKFQQRQAGEHENGAGVKLYILYGVEVAYTCAMAQRDPVRKRSTAGSSEIPDKLYFRIGEVARLCDVPAYVLRFWESEFPQLKPNKGGTGQRLYRRRDVEMALRIKALLYDEGFTIPGARQAIKSEMKQGAPQLTLGMEGAGGVNPQTLRKLQKELRDLLTLLSKPAAARGVVHAMRPRTHRSTGANTRAQQSEPAGLFDASLKPRED